MDYLFEQNDAARIHAAIVEAAVAWSEYTFQHSQLMSKWHAIKEGEEKDRTYAQAHCFDEMADGKLAEIRYLADKLRLLQISASDT